MQERLLKKAKHGDADAFIKLCAPLESMVYRHCLTLLKQPADAQDAAQEAMLRAFRAIASFDGRSALATWLYTIAHNVSLDLLKRAYRHREGTSLDSLRELGLEPGDTGASPEAAYVQKSEQNMLRNAIAQLPAGKQTLLSLRYGDGMPYDQIASVMRMPLGTVKSTLSRAKEELRTAVQKMETEGNYSSSGSSMDYEGRSAT